ncbi:DUF885 family protein [Nocardiopsis sp. HNM0947]|uniref:DUF885 family protein n=1 Tax=Nocardiopsis coralli TaxID=2772213 RepID=A0ABR9PEE4_9ACTN|nr:DUF885 family protein [Nocardiopsis coralli]MBE3002193.1 DUF885 family protein [Nocardiopsis coralli]
MSHESPRSPQYRQIDALPRRLRALTDLVPGTMREGVGMHDYDGVVADLSPGGVEAGMRRLDTEAVRAYGDPHDEAHATAFEDGLRLSNLQLEEYRSNPLLHVSEMDLSGYDREYAPREQRERAKREHLRHWPRLVENALTSLDRVPAPVARSLMGAVEGVGADVPADLPPQEKETALAAHARLVAHVREAAENGPAEATLGADRLARLMGVPEAADVDLAALARRADEERDRLLDGLGEAAARLEPGRDAMDLTRELTARHPSADRVLDAAREWTRLARDFTAERGLVPDDTGDCRVEESPESQRWATAMMAGGGPWEGDTPSYYYITPPQPTWSPQESAEWLEMFSHTTLPAVSVHEVAPGHFSHWRSMHALESPVRAALHSMTFAEGWAHYAEEMLLEEGFGAYAAERVAGAGFLDGHDWTPTHYEIGVYVEALIRVTRLSVAIAMHTGGANVAEGAARFEADTPLRGPAALSEARRATFDPTYGRYTWGKLEILEVRERARRAWGEGFSLARFHRALLALGSPPIGLLGNALERG